MRVSNFSLLIPQGRERDSGHVEIAHGTVYQLNISNHDHRRCDGIVTIDGKEVGGFRIPGHATVRLETKPGDGGCFTFFRSDSAEAAAANIYGVHGDDRGLIQVVFRPERRQYRPEPTQTMSLKSMGGARGQGMGFCDEEKTSGGITGMTGHSNQQFHDVAPLDYDPGGEVTISLRLVASNVSAVRELRPANRGNPVPVPVE